MTYTYDDITNAAMRCQFAYPEFFDIRGAVLPSGFKVEIVDVYEVGNDFCYEAKLGAVRIFNFRGSNDKRDAWGNSQIEHVNSRYGLVHKGFCHKWVPFKSLILPTIKINDIIWVEGHSRGGALAQFFVAELSLKRICRSFQGITFGQPLCFGEVAADKFQDIPLLRVRNPNDRIPDQPSSWTRWIYENGYSKLYGEEIEVPHSFPVGEECWQTVGKKPRPAWPGRFSGHPIQKYINKSIKQGERYGQ